MHPVERLWRCVEGLPADWYPAGVVPLPGHVPGTAFFSPGAGLYRNTDAPLPDFPVGGVMFIGHNLDAEGPYRRRLADGVPHGNPRRPMATWRNLYRLLDGAGIERAGCFFTNAYVGLIAGDKPTGAFPGARDQRFTRWCRDFLAEQVEMMQPRVVVTLGRPAAQFLGLADGIGLTRIAKRDFATAALAHPSMHPANVRTRTHGGQTGVAAEIALLRDAAGTDHGRSSR